jgi:hypothetical protein
MYLEHKVSTFPIIPEDALVITRPTFLRWLSMMNPTLLVAVHRTRKLQ